MNSNAPSIPLSLYVHLPWCERKCPYCDFNSHEQFDASQESAYIEALLKDLELQQDKTDGRPLQSVFIGGGTPSLFSPKAIEQLLSGIASRYPMLEDIEITLESNPGSADQSRFQGYLQAGVTRLSLGVQSFDDAALQALGRVHNGNQARAALDAALAVFPRVNADLMHGLPQQSPISAVRDLQQALAQGVEHLSWYQLTIEPNTTFWSKPPTLPVEDALADIQEQGESLLELNGFRRYEISAWSRNGDNCRHNLNYWQFGDYIGIGAGAHGKLTQSTGVFRTQRSRIPTDYIANIASQQGPKTTRVKDDDLAGEFMLNALRLSEGVSASLFHERTGLSLRVIQTELDRAVVAGLLIHNSQHIAPTALGLRFHNDLVARFL